MDSPAYLGSTIRIQCDIKDFDGNPLIPDSHEIKILDGSGTQVGDLIVEVQSEEDGVYYIDFVVPTDKLVGNWKVIWKILKNGEPDIRAIEFEVAEV